MKNIYVCTPFRGEEWKNIRIADECCNHVLKEGHLPICTVNWLGRWIDVDTTDNKIIYLCLQYVKLCDEVWVFGEPTAGMQEEIKFARELGKTIKEL